MKLIMYKCPDCECGFGIANEYRRDYPFCPHCGSDDCIGTAEKIEGEVKGDCK